MAHNNSRRWIVFLSLTGVLSLTSVLLVAMATDPLRPDAADSLFAVDSASSMDRIFDTQVPSDVSSRWRYIYIHHSKSANGNAQLLGQAANSIEGMGDHFLIGNGDGCSDGEIQEGQRWNRQLTAVPPLGVTSMDPACIGICVIGDFDQTRPTPTQLHRLAQLVQALQAHYRIPATQVIWATDSPTAAGLGQNFPSAGFHEQLLSWPLLSR